MAKIFHNPDTWVLYCMQEDVDNTIDPATIKIKIVTHAETERYTRIIAKDSTDKNIVGQTTVLQNVSRKQFEEHLSEPSNFFYYDKLNKLVEMKTGGDLYDHADSETVSELLRAMESNAKLTAGQKKTLSSVSDTAERT